MFTPFASISTPRSPKDHVSIGFFFAIIIPLTFGLRISETPLSNAKTQGAEAVTFSCPVELGRVAVYPPPSEDTSDTRVTQDAKAFDNVKGQTYH